MKRYYNSAVLVGRVGKDALFKTFKDSNKGLWRFTLATNRYYKKDNNEIVRTTDWHKIVCPFDPKVIKGYYSVIQQSCLGAGKD
jgi:hypothetical protein